jgi:hypothetical protein
MTSVDINAFVDSLTDDLVANAPPEVRELVLADETLRDYVFAFQSDVRDGLEAIQQGFGTAADLERAMRARKTAIVARAVDHNFTVERVLAAAIEKVMARVRS